MANYGRLRSAGILPAVAKACPELAEGASGLRTRGHLADASSLKRCASIGPNQSRASRIAFMPSSIPAAIHGQKYISLTTLRKTGAGSCDSRLVRRRRRQALRDDPQRHGQDEANTQQPASTRSALHDSGNRDWPGVLPRPRESCRQRSTTPRARPFVANTGWHGSHWSGGERIPTSKSASDKATFQGFNVSRIQSF